jgi:hypothetical protein
MIGGQSDMALEKFRSFKREFHPISISEIINELIKEIICPNYSHRQDKPPETFVMLWG